MLKIRKIKQYIVCNKDTTELFCKTSKSYQVCLCQKAQCVRICHLLNSYSKHTLLLLYVTGVSVITPTVLSSQSGFHSHLFLQLAELSRHGLQANSCLLQLLVCRSDQVAAPVGRLTGIFQLTEGTTRLENKQNHPTTHSKSNSASLKPIYDTAANQNCPSDSLMGHFIDIREVDVFFVLLMATLNRCSTLEL